MLTCTESRSRLSRRLLICTGLVLALTTAGLAGFASPAAAARECGIYTGTGGPYAVRIMHGSTSCHTAHVVLRRYATSRSRCDGSSCLRVQHGWWCQTASSMAFPRLFSCSHGRRWVAAYAIAD